MEMHLPILSFMIHHDVREGIELFSEFLQDILRRSVVTMLRCSLGYSLLVKNTLILHSQAEDKVLGSTWL